MVFVFQARFKGKSALTGSYILQNSENGPVCPPPVQAAAAAAAQQAPSLVQPTTANAYLGYFPSSYGYGFAEQVRDNTTLNIVSLRIHKDRRTSHLGVNAIHLQQLTK